MIYSMKTDKGIVRENNQDNCSVSVFDDKSLFAVVCDGMGGPNAGEVASDIAVGTISEKVVSGWNNSLSLDEIKELLIEAVNSANIGIYKKAHEVASYEGMGTTAVLAVCTDNQVVFANVGDSRAYRVSDSLNQITKDHSYVQELLDSGKITTEEAENFPYKNIITRALGTKHSVTSDVFVLNDFSENDRIMLCSDGLFNYVSSDEIIEIINCTPIDSAASVLVDRANKNGGGDNISVVIFAK